MCRQALGMGERSACTDREGESAGHTLQLDVGGKGREPEVRGLEGVAWRGVVHRERLVRASLPVGAGQRKPCIGGTEGRTVEHNACA